jgi:hypothetical protein
VARLRTDGHRTALVSLATADDGGPTDDVDVCGGHRDHLARPHDGLQHEPHDGFVTAIAEVRPAARLHQRPDLLLGQSLDDLLVELGRLESRRVVLVDLALVGAPGDGLAHARGAVVHRLGALALGA